MSNTRTVPPQGRHIQETDLLGPAYEALSLFSGASEAQRVIMTAWAAHTNIYTMFPSTGRLDCCAEEPQSGKTVNMQVVLRLSQNGFSVGYTSQAAIYGWLDEHPNTTLGLDEADKIFGITGRSESRRVLAAIVNDGYTGEGRVMVMRNGHATLIPVFAPVALAGLGARPKDLQTRSFIIHLSIAEPEEPWVPELYGKTVDIIGAELAQALNTREALKFIQRQPKFAKGVKGTPRRRLIYAPLGAVTALAGCHDQFLEAVHEVELGLKSKPPVPLHEMLLRDLRLIWPPDEPIVPADELVTWLIEHDDAKWARLGDPESRIAHVALAGLFKQAGITTTTSNGVRGYRRELVAAVPEMPPAPRRTQNREQRTRLTTSKHQPTKTAMRTAPKARAAAAKKVTGDAASA